MRIVVAGFRAVARADLRLAPIALVGGPNEGGKTSLCQAVAAAVAGAVLPRIHGEPLATKGDAAALVRDGADRAVVTVTAADEDSGALASVVWPGCDRVTEGKAPQASVYATGALCLAALDPGARAAALVGLLQALPDRADFDGAMAGAGFDPAGDAHRQACDDLWELIELQGWDVAHGRQKERGARLKGQWQEVTGAAWGARKAAGWTPPGWTADLEAATRDGLAAEVAAVRAALEACIGAAAVSDAELARLREQAAMADAADAHAGALRSQFAAAQARRQAADAARRALPEVSGDSGLPCPWCGHHVRVGRGAFGEMTLQRFEGVDDPVEFDRRHKALAAADREVEAAQQQWVRLRTDLAEAEDQAATTAAAAARLSRLGDAAVLEARIGEARSGLAAVEQRLALFDRRARAASLRTAVDANTRVVALLAADGLRQRKLQASLAQFNERLAKIGALVGWPPVVIDAGMRITRVQSPAAAPRPYAHLSASARWRVDLVLQLAIATLEDADLLVVDALDICDARHRNAALAAICETGRPALVTMTCSARRLLPDLAHTGIGRSYWLEDGVATPLSGPGDAAA